MKSLSCHSFLKDAYDGAGCSEVFEADTEENVIDKAIAHARSYHHDTFYEAAEVVFEKRMKEKGRFKSS